MSDCVYKWYVLYEDGTAQIIKACYLEEVTEELDYQKGQPISVTRQDSLPW